MSLVRELSLRLIENNEEKVAEFVQLLNMNICRHNKYPHLLAITPKENTSRFFLYWNKKATNNLVLESNHPIFDRTGNQTLQIFFKTNAKFALISGYHRCSSSIVSPCTGKTTACGRKNGSAKSYPISDSAHAFSLFHEMHKVFFDQLPDHVFISLHGMKGRGLSVSSNMPSGYSVEKDSASYLMAKYIKGKFSNASSCQRRSPLPFKRVLCGTSNVQGRYSNNSPEECTKYSVKDSKRYIHMEQGSSARKKIKLMSSSILKMLKQYNSLHK